MSSSPRAIRWAVGLTACCVLSYEIALTRIFSVLFRSPYVFLILSIAICGLGLGSWFAGRDRDAPRGLVRPAVGLAVTLPLPLLLLLTVGRGLVAGAHGGAVAVCTLLPYVAAGVLLARAFRKYSADAGRLYFYDLSGAGLAALATAQLINLVGALAVPFLLGAAAAVGAGLLGARRWVASGLALGLLLLGGLQSQERLLRLPPVTSADSAKVKPLFQELADPAAGATIEYTRWSAVARTDVVSNRGVPVKYIWTDGDVPTQMEPFNGDLATAAGYQAFIGFLPYALQPAPDRVLCIGPGGGLDVLLALLGRSKAIEPVELNPAIGPVTDRFKGHYGDLYHRPELPRGLIIDEGRSYLSRSRQQYDVIYFALAKSATTQQGGMALVDNYLYTVEAFEAYFRRLAPGGLLALVLQEPNLTDRCLVTAFAALRRQGIANAAIPRRVAWVHAAPEYQGSPYRQLLLIRNGPYPAAAARQLRWECRRRGLQTRLLPDQAWPEPYAVAARPETTAEAFSAAVASQDDYLQRLYFGGPWERLQLRIVTDDRPFYADFSPRLHPFLSKLLKWSLGAGLVCLLWGVWELRQRGVARPAAVAGYFGALGAGFMLVEVALIQKLVLLLGYPTLALTAILFSLLLGCALGGSFTNRGPAAAAARRLPWVFLTLLLAVLLVRGVLTPLTTALLPAALPWRLLAAVVVTLPLGFLLGQPFPTGLRLLGERQAAAVPAAWAINGVLSVTGSVVAAAAASRLGYSAVLLGGLSVYVGAWLTASRWCHDTATTGSVEAS
ncbi:MAG: hypothetical protein IT204_09065 [Fimbriimonadaceae bacterium]|nr:hypothetical protein [Fimbriimonadaceae bacterium]